MPSRSVAHYLLAALACSIVTAGASLAGLSQAQAAKDTLVMPFPAFLKASISTSTSDRKLGRWPRSSTIGACIGNRDRIPTGQTRSTQRARI